MPVECSGGKIQAIKLGHRFCLLASRLVHPVYAGVKSFWDVFYSTLWLDGLNSGVIDFMPWNEHFMVAGALLALLPSIFILTGIISGC